MRLLVEFSREGSARFASHLDMQRAFMRWLRRSGLNCEYSQGFNPHILMSVAAPMPVGLVSRSDYFEVRISGEITGGQAVDALAVCAPAGITPLFAGRLEDTAPKLMAAVAFAEYRITAEDVAAAAARAKAGEIYVEARDGAKKEVSSMIRSFEAQGDAIRAMLAFGGAGTLNPGALMDALGQRAEYVRTGLYTKETKPLRELCGK